MGVQATNWSGCITYNVGGVGGETTNKAYEIN